MRTNIQLVLGFVLITTCHQVRAAIGVDMSSGECGDMAQSDWDCLQSNGYSFAIIEAYQGGYGQNPDIAACVARAWKAGFAHVDMYMFMCPNCVGNVPPSQGIDNLISSAQQQGINYGMLWFDIEQCSGCWSDDLSSNCDFVGEMVTAAQNAGATVGIYSSLYEWGQTVGEDCASFSSLPLWYADWNGEPSFDDQGDWSFGGWTKPAIKQWKDSGPCADVDSDYYP